MTSRVQDCEPVCAAQPSASRGVWFLAVAGAVAMFLVQPPADLWMLAWLAPLPWLGLVQSARLSGRHPWRVLWIVGFLHWLLAIHWLRLPHPATSIGWVALSAYLAAYLPLFIWTTRRLVHRAPHHCQYPPPDQQMRRRRSTRQNRSRSGSDEGFVLGDLCRDHRRINAPLG